MNERAAIYVIRIAQRIERLRLRIKAHLCVFCSSTDGFFATEGTHTPSKTILSVPNKAVVEFHAHAAHATRVRRKCLEIHAKDVRNLLCYMHAWNLLCYMHAWTQISLIASDESCRSSVIVKLSLNAEQMRGFVQDTARTRADALGRPRAHLPAALIMAKCPFASCCCLAGIARMGGLQ